jgi:glycosyltransferase involved in cell wall biosynthesis
VYHPANAPQVVQTVAERVTRDRSLAFLGRIVDQKDPHLLLSTFRNLPDDWTLHMIGSGDPELVRDLQRMAEDQGLADRVIWHGWKTREDAHGILSDAGVLAVTSRAENYCHAAVEAMILGTPVVMVNRVASARDFGAMRCAAVCDPDPIAISQAVLKMTEDSDHRNSILAAGKRFGAERLLGVGVEKVAELLA